MWVVRNKNGELLLFNQKPVKSIDYFDGEVIERWTRDIEKYPPVHFSSKTALYDPNYQITCLDNSLFPDITWEDEPIECNLFLCKCLKICSKCGKRIWFNNTNVHNEFSEDPWSGYREEWNWIECPECKEKINV